MVCHEAEEDGTLNTEETKLIRSVIEFDDLEVGDILVPRVNIVAVDISSSMEDIKKIFGKERRLGLYPQRLRRLRLHPRQVSVQAGRGKLRRKADKFAHTKLHRFLYN